MRNELPEFYFFVLPDSGQLVTIRRNEHGYYHSDWSTDDKVRNQEIADYMHISINTVKFHISSIYQKVGVSSRKELEQYLLR